MRKTLALLVLGAAALTAEGGKSRSSSKDRGELRRNSVTRRSRSGSRGSILEKYEFDPTTLAQLERLPEEKQRVGAKVAAHEQLYYLFFGHLPLPLQDAGFVFAKAALEFSRVKYRNERLYLQAIDALMEAKDILVRAAAVPMNEMMNFAYFAEKKQGDTSVKEAVACMQAVPNNVEAYQLVEEFGECRKKFGLTQGENPGRRPMPTEGFFEEYPVFEAIRVKVTAEEERHLRKAYEYFDDPKIHEIRELSDRIQQDAFGGESVVGASSKLNKLYEKAKELPDKYFTGVKNVLTDYLLDNEVISTHFLNMKSFQGRGPWTGKTQVTDIFFRPDRVTFPMVAVLEPLLLSRHVMHLGTDLYKDYLKLILKAKDVMSRAGIPPFAKPRSRERSW